MKELWSIAESGCWLWTGSKAKNGYGMSSEVVAGRRVSQCAHRYTYRMFIGEIPHGLEIDHLCRIRDCVNPWHLEPVSHKTNMERARAAAPTKDSCSRGHILNRIWIGADRTHRRCSICDRDRKRRYRASSK